MLKHSTGYCTLNSVCDKGRENFTVHTDRKTNAALLIAETPVLSIALVKVFSGGGGGQGEVPGGKRRHV